MPVTFAEQPKGRRLSASAPFPGRVMTSLVPADVPRKKRTGSRGRGSVTSISSVGSYGAAGSESAGPGPGPVPENPFADDSGIARAGVSGISVASAGAEYERMMPEGVPTIAVYGDNGEAERQPLLAIEEEDRIEVPWAFTLAIAGAIGVATFVILYVWRVAGEEGTLARK